MNNAPNHSLKPHTRSSDQRLANDPFWASHNPQYLDYHYWSRDVTWSSQANQSPALGLCWMEQEGKSPPWSERISAWRDPVPRRKPPCCQREWNNQQRQTEEIESLQGNLGPEQKTLGSTLWHKSTWILQQRQLGSVTGLKSPQLASSPSVPSPASTTQNMERLA